ncbi:unnamed protein product [Mytilus edulis]|uniref:Uncharacterized protein n=1 Tax=Mytilus edulis TaxID=6550 RepID=A0A8S3UTU6_MYTED|nr:unnamed protein product [Mytilus edulis]
MGAISSSTRSIEQDHKDIQSMFFGSKMGKWPDIDDGVLLQQAVWLNNSSAIKTLIQFQTCDKDLKAKDGISEKGPTGGHTAQQIAELFGYLEVSNIIKNHIPSQREENIDTYYDGNSSIENEEYGLFRITLAAYKRAFHPSHVDKTKQLSVLLNDVFKHVDTGNNWMAVRDKVAQALFSSCEEASKVVSQCTTKSDFYKRIVNVYTDETTQLYTNMNTALRRQRIQDSNLQQMI